MAGKNDLDVGTLLGHIKMDTLGLIKGERAAKRSTNAINKSLKGTEHSANLASKALIAFGSVATLSALSRVASSIVHVGMAFESEMATVKGVMRASASDFAALEKAAEHAGITTAWSAKQSAEALKYMGMAGWSAQKSIAALPRVLKFASAAGMDLGRASDIVTDSLTAMGLGVEELDDFTDTLIGVTTRANTNVEMLGESLKFAAPVAAQMGVDIKELSAMLGVLANSGIKASIAGSDLKASLIRNSKAAKILGTANNDLIGTLKAAKKAGWGVNEVQKTYGMYAAKSILILMNQIDAYEKLKGKLEGVRGETEALANTKLDTVEGDFKLLKSAIDGIGIKASKVFREDLRGGIQDFVDFIKKNEKTILDFIGDTGEIATDVATIGKEIASVITGVIKGWSALPTTIQEVGIIGVLLGGKKFRAVMLAATTVLAAVNNITDAIDQATIPSAGGGATATPKDNSGDVEFITQSIKVDGKWKQFQIPKITKAEVPTPDYPMALDRPGPINLAAVGPTERELKDTAARIKRAKEGQAKAEEIRRKKEEALKAQQLQGIFDLFKQENAEYARMQKEKESILSDWSGKSYAATHNQFETKLFFLEREAEAIREKLGDDKEAIAEWERYYKAVLKSTNKEYAKWLEDQKEKTKDLTTTMADAFVGWGASFSQSLTDMLYNSETTFKDIGLAFSKMITQMVIQKVVIEPLFKDISKMLTDAMGTGIGAAAAGAGAGAGSVGVPFTGVTRLHNGLKADEFPAILQRGEQVIPRGQSSNSDMPSIIIQTRDPETTVKFTPSRGQKSASQLRTIQRGASNL